MRHTHCLVFCQLFVLAIMVTPGVAVGQSGNETWTVPRTADGHPDLQGVWANNSATPLERPEELAGKPTLSDEELAELKQTAERLFGDGGDAAFADGVFEAALAGVENYVSGDGGSGNYSTVWMVDRDFENRTSLITDPNDGRLPALTQDAEARAADRRGRRGVRDGAEDLSLQVRCITYSVPRVGGLGAGYNSYYQIFQAADHVVLHSEMIHDSRVIPLDGRPHIADNIRQWHGDSRGHWEGDTLVIETRNFSPRSLYRGSSDNLHLVERFTRVGPDVLHYEQHQRLHGLDTAVDGDGAPLEIGGCGLRVCLPRRQHRDGRYLVGDTRRGAERVGKPPRAVTLGRYAARNENFVLVVDRRHGLGAHGAGRMAPARAKRGVRGRSPRLIRTLV